MKKDRDFVVVSFVYSAAGGEAFFRLTKPGEP